MSFGQKSQISCSQKKKKKKHVQGDDISFYLEDLREISFSNNFKKLLPRLIHDGILQHTTLQKKKKKLP